MVSETRLIPPVTRVFDFHWSAPEQTVEQTIETPVIWDKNKNCVQLLSDHGFVHELSTNWTEGYFVAVTTGCVYVILPGLNVW